MASHLLSNGELVDHGEVLIVYDVARPFGTNRSVAFIGIEVPWLTYASRTFSGLWKRMMGIGVA